MNVVVVRRSNSPPDGDTSRMRTT